MTREQYMRITDRLRKDPAQATLVRQVNRILTWLVFWAYPCYLFSLFQVKDEWLVRAVLVPLISFIAITVARFFINEPRPYEKFELPPIIEKRTKGRSFPSRHVFSVFMIGMTVAYRYPTAGTVFFLIGVVLAVIRVLGGVHEPKDVFAGAVSGILCGVVGYYLF